MTQRHFINGGLAVGLLLMFAGAWMVWGLGPAVLATGWMVWATTLITAKIAFTSSRAG